jgi:hypothetical protein
MRISFPTLWLALGFSCLILPGILLPAQTLPPLSPDRLSLVGDRIEAITILGGDYGASGGAYKFGANVADISLTRLGGGGDLSDPRPLGSGKLKWNPVANINLGWISAEKTIQQAPLAGNTIQGDVFGFAMGGGARFWFTDRLSLAPTLGGIYGHSKNNFNVLNDAGMQYVGPMSQAGWVNWSVDTWTVVPATDLKYIWTWKRTGFTANSTFNYYHTGSFNSTSQLVKVDGNSQTWVNKLDADVPLGWKIKGYEFHTGGYVRLTELYGNISSGLNSDRMYTVHGRLVLDSLGQRFKLRWLGVGASYFGGKNFNGWAIGIDTRLKKRQ